MSIIDIFQSIIDECGRDDMDSDIGRRAVLRWLNTYKLHIQRNKRVVFSSNTTTITAETNSRATDAPSDFLSFISIRRPVAEVKSETSDPFGNRFFITKETVLHPWLDKEAFLDRFPNNVSNNPGDLLTGVPNDYMLQGGSIIWGPIPREDETFYLDYYRLIPPYNFTDNIEDDFTRYFDDGLFNRCMEMVFTTWIPDKEKKQMWAAEKMISENSLNKFFTLRQIPMESQLNMPG